MTTAIPTSPWDDLADQTTLTQDYPPEYRRVLAFFLAVL